MRFVQINTVDLKSGRLYLIVLEESQSSCYAIVTEHMGRESLHKCGYLNVDKLQFHVVVSDEFIQDNDITFDGIGSELLRIRPSVLETFPVEAENYWVGIDYMDSENPMPEDDEVLTRLSHIYEQYVARAK